MTQYVYRDTRVDRPHYVYRCFDTDGRLLYVGCSFAPTRRLKEHRRTAWFSDVAFTAVEQFPDRRSAFDAEREAIYAERPVHNVKCNETWRWRSR